MTTADGSADVVAGGHVLSGAVPWLGGNLSIRRRESTKKVHYRDNPW